MKPKRGERAVSSLTGSINRNHRQTPGNRPLAPTLGTDGFRINSPTNQAPRAHQAARWSFGIFSGLPVLLLHIDSVAQGDRRRNAAELLEAGAGAADIDRPIAEDAPDQRLVDRDRLDLFHVHLAREPADEATLVDDAPVGHHDLGVPLV